MSKYKKIFSFILSIIAIPILACNSSHVIGSGGSGAVYTMSADTMQQGDIYVGVTAEYAYRKNLSDVTIENAVNYTATKSQDNFLRFHLPTAA